MNVWMIFKVSVLAILRNKTRAMLTCLGIIAGIASVIIVLAIGKGSQSMMVKQLSSMGNNFRWSSPNATTPGLCTAAWGRARP